jgi:hypothetical protein
MRNACLIAIVALAIILMHCASGKPVAASPGFYINHQKLNGRSFHKLFIQVQTVDVQIRSLVETDMVEALKLAGFGGVKSIDLIPFSLKELKLPTEEEINLKVKESGCDGILLITLSLHGESVEYTPGTVRNGGEQIGAGLLGMALNRDKGDNIKDIAPVNTPGSFSRNAASLILQSKLYDVPASELMCAIPSEPVEVSTMDKKSKAFAATLVEQLRGEKLLK